VGLGRCVFTAKAAKIAKNIAKVIALLSHRSISSGINRKIHRSTAL